LNGMTAQATSASTKVISGAIMNTAELAPVGITVSLSSSFNPSASGCSSPTTTTSTPTTMRRMAQSCQMPTIRFQISAMGAGLRAGVGAIGFGTGGPGRRRTADRIGHVVVLDRIGESLPSPLPGGSECAPGGRGHIVDMGEDRIDRDQALAQ